MLNAIGDSLSDLASSDNGEGREDDDDDEAGLELGKLNKVDEPGWVMGTISEMVQHHMGRFWQKQMKLNEWSQRSWRDAVDNFGETDKKYGTTELKVPAVIRRKQQMEQTRLVLATVPFLDSFEYSGSKKSWPQPVRSRFVPNVSLN